MKLPTPALIWGNCTYIAPGIQALFAIDVLDELPQLCSGKLLGWNMLMPKALRAGKVEGFLVIDVLIDYSRNCRLLWPKMGQTSSSIIESRLESRRYLISN
jgi:hypothetical protein